MFAEPLIPNYPLPVWRTPSGMYGLNTTTTYTPRPRRAMILSRARTTVVVPHARAIPFPRLPTGRFPSDDEDSDPDALNPFTQPRTPEPVQQEDDDSLNANGPDFKWPELAPIDQQLLSPFQTEAWELRPPMVLLKCLQTSIQQEQLNAF